MGFGGRDPVDGFGWDEQARAAGQGSHIAVGVDRNS